MLIKIEELSKLTIKLTGICSLTLICLISVFLTMNVEFERTCLGHTVTLRLFLHLCLQHFIFPGLMQRNLTAGVTTAVVPLLGPGKALDIANLLRLNRNRCMAFVNLLEKSLSPAVHRQDLQLLL